MTSCGEKLPRSAELLREYLPEPLTGEELEAAVDAAIAEAGATSMKDMGAVMKIINTAHKGRVDGKADSGLVRSRLA